MRPVRSVPGESPGPGARVVDPGLSLGQALRPFRARFLWAGVYFVAVALIGTAGYVIIEGWTWFDALYMAVTTVASVGFMELYPLSSAGRSFTMFLIPLGVTGLGIWWALTTALIVELDLGGVLRRRMMVRKIEELSDHYIVCGAGRMGRVVIRELLRTATKFVVIEWDGNRVAQVTEDFPDAPLIAGDATKESVLTSANVAKARGVAACLAEDADNLLVCLTVRGMSRDVRIVSRAYNEESYDKLHRAGADHVVSPNVTGGIRMTATLLRPSVVSFLDAATHGADIDLRLEETEIHGGSPLAGRSLADARIPQRTGLIVLALRRPDASEGFVYNPGPETELRAGDVMIVLGDPSQVQKLRAYVTGAKPSA